MGCGMGSRSRTPSKAILIDGKRVTANLSYLGTELVWVSIKGTEHIVPRKFWDGHSRTYKEPVGGPNYRRIEGDEEHDQQAEAN